MRFNTNLYEERQYWIQDICENGGFPPGLQTVQASAYDVAVARRAADRIRTAAAAKAARQAAVAASYGGANRLSPLWSGIAKGAGTAVSKLALPFSALSLLGGREASAADVDWNSYYAPGGEGTDSAGLTDQQIQQGIIDGVFDPGGAWYTP